VPHGRRKTRRIPFGDGDGRRRVETPCIGDDLNTYFPPIGAAYLAASRVRTGGSMQPMQSLPRPQTWSTSQLTTWREYSRAR